MISPIILSYAQSFEDVLLWRALWEVEGGFYIDIGAQDPVIDSVSRGFYEMGWRGIHVEPSAFYAERLRKDRPDEVVVQAAVADEPGLLTFFEVPDTGMSTVLPSVAEKAAATGRAVQKTTVTAVTLDQILGLCEGREVHWLKIDVEGYEGSVLKGWRKSDVRPWVVVLESVAPHSNEPVHEAWEPELAKRGYEFAYFDGLNRFYVSSAHGDLKPRLGYGASFWDQFHLPEHSRLMCVPVQQNRQRMSALREELEAARRERDQLESQLTRTQQDVSSMQEETERARAELDRLREALAGAHEACARFEGAFAESELALTKNRADLAFAHEELNRTRRQAAELQSNHEELQARAGKLASDLEATAAELEGTRQDLAQIRGDWHATEQASLQLSAELESVKAELAMIRGKYEFFQAGASVSAAELESTRSEVAVLQGKYDSLQEAALRSAAELGQSNAELTVLRGRYEALQAAALRSSKELQQSQAEVADMRLQHSALQGAALRWSSELEQATAALADLQARHAELEKVAARAAADRDEASGRLSEMQSTYAAMESELHAYRQSASSDLQATKAALAALQAQYDALNQSALRSAAELSSTRSALNALQTHFDELQRAAFRSAAELEDANRALTEAKRRYQAAQDAAARPVAELDRKQAQLEAAQADCRALREATRDHADELRSWQARYFAAEEQAASCASALDEAFAAAARAERESHGLRDALLRTNSHAEASRADAATFRAAHREAVRAAESLSAENQLLKRALTQIRDTIEKACVPNPMRNVIGRVATVDDQPAASLEELLAYHDEAFVRKAYATLLRRPADSSGLDHFLRMLRAGRNRLALLHEIRNSEEGRAVNASLPGLDEALVSMNGHATKSLRTRLARRIGGGEPPDMESQATIARLAEEIPRLSETHREAVEHIAGLHSILGEISGILEQPLDPEAMLPVRIVGGDAPVAEELHRAFLHSGIESGAGPVPVVVGTPDVPLDPDVRDPVLVGHDWDEAGYPEQWIETLNERYLAVGCTSRHARKVLMDHGAEVAVDVIGLGVDHLDRMVPAGLGDIGAKSFRFVHVAREPDNDGTDLAIESFARVFRDSDDVSLIVACSQGAAAEVQAWIEAGRSGNQSFPDVLVGVGPCGDPELKSLFAQCHALLAPARASGFSTDIALAYSAGLDVIATRWGGHLDYCSDDCAWLIDYDFERSTSPKSPMVSVWTRAKDVALDDALRAVHASAPEERESRATVGREKLNRRFTWQSVAPRILETARRARSRPPLPNQRIGWISTWNVKCGIASMASHQAESLPEDDVVIFAARQGPLLRPDSSNCLRIWEPSKESNGLSAILDELETWSVGALVLHFNYGFYNFPELAEFLERAADRGTVLVVDLHSTTDISDHDPNLRLEGMLGGFRRCHRLLAHTPADMNRLKEIGLVDNVMLYPHGILNRGYEHQVRDLAGREPLLASFGYCLPNKGLPELVEAVAVLRDRGRIMRLRMLNAQHPHPVSINEVQGVWDAIERHGLAEQIDFRPEYLDDDTVLELLHEADLIVNPYQRTGEAASGAVRFGLASGRPVAVTPIPIFDDLGGTVFRMPGIAPAEMADGIEQCLAHLADDSPEYRSVREVTRQWLGAHYYDRQAGRLVRLIRALQREAAEASTGETN